MQKLRLEHGIVSKKGIKKESRRSAWYGARRGIRRRAERLPAVILLALLCAAAFCAIPDGQGGVAQTPAAGGIAQTSGAGGMEQTLGAGGIAQTSGAGGMEQTSAAGGVAQTPAAVGMAQTPGADGMEQTSGAGGMEQTSGAGGMAQTPAAGGVKGAVAERIQERAYRTYFPVFSFVERAAGEGEALSLLAGMFGNAFPLYEYAGGRYASAQAADDDKGKGGGAARDGGLPGERTAYGEGVRLEETDLIDAVKRENETKALAEAGGEGAEREFVEAEKAETINMTELSDFDTLISRFYAVDSTTYIDREQLNIKKLAEQDMRLAQTDASKPQILIYHTHSQEGFADSVPGDDATTIMAVGERLAQLLRGKYGYNVIHHMGKYDVESRDYAYSNAAPDLERVLAANPSVEVIIDLHRDEVPADRRLVTELGGRQTAQFMFFNGLSRTTRTGEIEYLQNPNLEENLAFSFQMQRASCEYYPGITRKIYLKGYRYNMHYRGKTLLIELGAQNNTLEEAMNACDPLAHVLHLVLSGEE